MNQFNVWSTTLQQYINNLITDNGGNSAFKNLSISNFLAQQLQDNLTDEIKSTILAAHGVPLSGPSQFASHTYSTGSVGGFTIYNQVVLSHSEFTICQGKFTRFHPG